MAHDAHETKVCTIAAKLNDCSRSLALAVILKDGHYTIDAWLLQTSNRKSYMSINQRKRKAAVALNEA